MTEDEVFNQRLKALLRHIDNVRNACVILGERLIERGDKKLGLSLIANGYQHDNSKFYGLEWDYLNTNPETDDKETLMSVVKHHSSTNMHHPEYWGGIDKMPRLYLAEAVCDWFARSAEFGSDLRKWVKESASKRFGFSLQGGVYKQIKEFLDILLDPSFK